MKFWVLFFVLMSKVSAFASTTINEGELKLFFSTLVNVDPIEGIETVNDYLEFTGHKPFVDPQLSAQMSPLPGKVSKMDATCSLLCLSPMMNQAVAIAQFRFMETTLYEELRRLDAKALKDSDTTLKNKEGIIALRDKQLKEEQGRVYDLTDIIEQYRTLIGKLELQNLQNGAQLALTKKSIEESLKRLGIVT